MEIQSVGVVGAGQMGNGIAQVCAMAGLSVVLTDVSSKALEKAQATIANSLARLVKKGQLSDPDAVLSRIVFSNEMADLAAVDIAIEAATERLEIKIDILRQLSALVRPEAIIASNTSSISLTVLAAQVSQPQRAIGMHFMNPVPVMQLVEIIRALQTDDATHAATVALAERLGKTPVSVNDAPGFVSNRVLMPMINEAVFCLYEGIATPEAIDTVMKLGMNHPIGPLALADLIGLDTCLAIMDVLYHEFRDSKYRACPLLVQKVAAGHLGRKSGQGFYRYDQ
ncbi:3-hydroxybutyryl-CoA dehydrogenase [Aquaspirillum serpens]|uniref:3-hydroxybutyryl-CoA dehydrogenase n=1 Tax=Aquaspirillum serpens TaxID=190 RepID=UPI0003B327A0|nr:3-hydroxybutyryl-CoA dehydrogenase [Aquaspirillum serpens]MBP7970499.1 3-hydroxybutyryl-CoA dehydrogenase [Aquaspirillum sp.]